MDAPVDPQNRARVVARGVALVDVEQGALGAQVVVVSPMDVHHGVLEALAVQDAQVIGKVAALVHIQRGALGAPDALGVQVVVV